MSETEFITKNSILHSLAGAKGGVTKSQKQKNQH
jgi:hypothetical protein